MSEVPVRWVIMLGSDDRMQAVKRKDEPLSGRLAEIGGWTEVAEFDATEKDHGIAVWMISPGENGKFRRPTLSNMTDALIDRYRVTIPGKGQA